MLAFTEATDAPDLHVFDNAAFSDDEEETKEEMPAISVSWRSPRPSFFDSMESDSGKENRSPEAFSSIECSWRPQKPLKLLHPQSVNVVEKPLKSILKNGVSSTAKKSSESDKISAGIEEIETEIRRLTGKLAELRLQQAAAAEAETKAEGKQQAECEEKNRRGKENKPGVEILIADSCNLETPVCTRQPVKRGRMVAAKFMTSVASSQKRMVEVREQSDRFRQDRRKSCFTRMPAEEEKEIRKESRSLSLSPRKSQPRVFKITGFPTVESKVPARKADATTLPKPRTLFPDNATCRSRRDHPGKVPDQPAVMQQSRRKSCYFKLPKEDEKEKTKGPRSSSLSPKKSLPSVSKTPGFLTVGSKKSVKRDGLTHLTQPKALFQEEETGGGRKPVAGNLKNSRVVGSRYGKTTTVSTKGISAGGPQSSLKGKGKHILLENRKEVINEKPISPEKPDLKSTATRRKVWMQESPVTTMTKLLPKIRTVLTLPESPCDSAPESPRDSGRVKRAVDRIGKMSYFQGEDELVSIRSLDVPSFEEE